MLTLKKGVNLGGFLSQCSEYTTEHYETFITESDLDTIVDLKFDHIRLPIDYEVIEHEDGSEIKENYRFIDDILKWCRKRSLKVVLDIHKTWGYFFDDANVAGRNTLFDSPEAQDRFVALWDRMSKRYADCHDFVAYELLNEVVNPEYCKPWNELIKRTVLQMKIRSLLSTTMSRFCSLIRRLPGYLRYHRISRSITPRIWPGTKQSLKRSDFRVCPV